MLSLYHLTIHFLQMKRPCDLLNNSKVIAGEYAETLIDISCSKFPCAHCLPYSQRLGSSDSFPYAFALKVGRNKQPHSFSPIIENVMKGNLL